MNCHCLRGGGHADKVAARGAHAAFVGSVGQLVLHVQGPFGIGGLRCLCMHCVLVTIIGGIRMMVVSFRIAWRLQNHMVGALAAILHGCRGKALHGQSQHHEPEQEGAKTRHRVLIL